MTQKQPGWLLAMALLLCTAIQTGQPTCASLHLHNSPDHSPYTYAAANALILACNGKTSVSSIAADHAHYRASSLILSYDLSGSAKRTDVAPQAVSIGMEAPGGRIMADQLPNAFIKKLLLACAAPHWPTVG